MAPRILSRWVVAVLILIGMACLASRYYVRREARAAREDSLWRLTYDLRFTAGEGGARVAVALPKATLHCRLVHEELSLPGLRRDPGDAGDEDRELVVFTRRDGEFHVVGEFDLALSPRDVWHVGDDLVRLTPESRALYLRREKTIQIESEAVREVLKQAPTYGQTRAALLEWIFDYCARDITTAASDGAQDAAGALETGKATALGRARAMVALCRASRIPARLVAGFDIRQEPELVPHVWVEAFREHQWIPFDPENGFARKLPAHFVPARLGGSQIVRARGASGLTVEYSAVRLPPPESVLTAGVRRPAQILDLTRLPLEMHEVMALMLLLPLGALITAFCRNLIGLKTFGTFTPALLAMSFIYAAWGTGVVVLSVVIAAGFLGRSFLQRLQLLMVPRLSVILTMVILCVIFGVSLLDYLAITPSAQAVLLPLVILTMMVERVYVTTEEDGIQQSLLLGFGTLVVATLCYLILRWDSVGRFMLIYPETHLITLGVFVMIGRYAGYRLTELWRFRDLT